ncbi:flagellar biosynthesis anti-sigma factor FlgM [Anaerotignum sp. MB30-C6]|uniref:flagellar biosynthesis anti-sigma factor FlgM n=1 Tax=Anaerotignum sp. MB30-C6 TaxID=3070814 RepID=UPI0027DE9948|nr:flagellar biosynthesis anti-sigma factor FlgM [Anaerotignum sp. MB30-C6]WMI81005.1 flagellar biosynthesis anti-sigma factor FlgM [Anaerotignum sp. MB30-C6]
MKVTLNSFFNLQPTNKNKEKTTQIPAQNATARNKNCDEIIISAKFEKADESRFVSELKNNISTEVNTPCSEEKIANLKQQIAEGTYKIDIDEIAKKMLLQ